MIHSFVFSPSGTTAKIADAITRCLGMETTTHNLTVKASGDIDISSDADIAVFAMPVYAGRIPALAADRLQAVSGKGQNAVVTVVYGNRDYDDALIELADIATARGFNVIAAGAFIAQHCIFPKVATGRPDSGDAQKLAEFARIAAQAAADGHRLDLDKIKGKRPYKKAAGVPLHPQTDTKKCNSCSTCATQCPTGAIDSNNPKLTDGKKCITCCRCINICPNNARQLGGLLYKIAGYKFIRDNSRRLEPEWFV